MFMEKYKKKKNAVGSNLFEWLNLQYRNGIFTG